MYSDECFLCTSNYTVSSLGSTFPVDFLYALIVCNDNYLAFAVLFFKVHSCSADHDNSGINSYMGMNKLIHLSVLLTKDTDECL